MSETKPTQQGDPSDPLSTLHRMSTTAGVASQEYVAINLTAVAALVLGLASALVLLSSVLLAIPLAALVAGIFALRQIHNSSGTQTGRALAVIGMLVAIGFGGFIGLRTLQEHNATKAEQTAIEQMLKEFEQKILAKDYQGTLPLFVDGFLEKKQITADQYALTWARATESAAYGDIKSVGITRLVLSPKGESGERAAGSMLVIAFEKSPQPLRREITFRKVGSDWKIDDIPQIFPAPAPAPPTGPPGSAGPMPGGMPPM